MHMVCLQWQKCLRESGAAGCGCREPLPGCTLRSPPGTAAARPAPHRLRRLPVLLGFFWVLLLVFFFPPP